jgi:hypothetical protein
MATIAVTGHMDLTEDSVPLVRGELERILAAYEPAGLTGACPRYASSSCGPRN